ncbi:MAG: hypothetical protein R3298_07670 [Gammaproteobacteria bacterium]|nr:hypothetical protein [Gammaproteobacteria bacterium]
MRPIPSLLLVLALLSGAYPAAAQETPVEALRGLNVIEFSVIGVTPEMEAEGLYSRDILDEIDRRLRGTRLLLRRGRARSLAGTGALDPLLQVTPSCRQIGGGRRLCQVSVELREGVSLVRDPSVRFLGTSWRNVWFGEVNRYSELRERIESMVDQFAQDYGAVN